MVQSRVEDLSPVVKKVSVELTPDRVKDALDTAYTTVSRTVKLKGYRAIGAARMMCLMQFGAIAPEAVLNSFRLAGRHLVPTFAAEAASVD